jgi:hypothetical protein
MAKITNEELLKRIDIAGTNPAPTAASVPPNFPPPEDDLSNTGIPATAMREDLSEPGTPVRDLRVIASRISADLHTGQIGHLTSWCVMRLVEIADSLTHPAGARSAPGGNEQRLRDAIHCATSTLWECVSIFEHPNFTDRHGTAERVRAAYEQCRAVFDSTPDAARPQILMKALLDRLEGKNG